MKRKINVLLVDDHSVVRAGYRLLLSQSADIGGIWEADCGESACRLYVDYKPDIVVMDISMAGIGGLSAIRRICSRDSAARILVFSIHEESVYVTKSIEAGAKGYITKRSAPEIMIAAVVKIAQGKTYVETGLLQDGKKVTGFGQSHLSLVESLSAREFDVFVRMAKGSTTREIADQLCLGYKTVANYSTSIKSKLGVNTGAEVAGIAYEIGLLGRK